MADSFLAKNLQFEKEGHSRAKWYLEEDLPSGSVRSQGNALDQWSAHIYLLTNRYFQLAHSV